MTPADRDTPLYRVLGEEEYLAGAGSEDQPPGHAAPPPSRAMPRRRFRRVGGVAPLAIAAIVLAGLVVRSLSGSAGVPAVHAPIFPAAHAPVLPGVSARLPRPAAAAPPRMPPSPPRLSSLPVASERHPGSRPPVPLLPQSASRGRSMRPPIEPQEFGFER